MYGVILDLAKYKKIKKKVLYEYQFTSMLITLYTHRPLYSMGKSTQFLPNGATWIPASIWISYWKT